MKQDPRVYIHMGEKEKAHLKKQMRALLRQLQKERSAGKEKHSL